MLGPHRLSISPALISFLALVIACSSAACSKSGPGSAPASSADSPHGDHGDHEHRGHRGHGEHRGRGEHGEPGSHGRDEPGPLVHRFEKAEDWAARWDASDRHTWQKPDEIIAHMAIEPGMAVVDIGAGTGYFLPHLSRAVGPGGMVLGLDIEKDMVRYMLERISRENLTNATARQVAGDDPGLAPASIDRILLVNVWHHIPDRERYAARLAGALRPGGTIHVVDFTLASDLGPQKKHRLAPDLVARELATAGLTVETHSDVLPEQYIVVARTEE